MLKLLKMLFCNHQWEVVFEGIHFYQKGAREKIYTEGVTRECKKCGLIEFKQKELYRC